MQNATAPNATTLNLRAVLVATAGSAVQVRRMSREKKTNIRNVGNRSTDRLWEAR